MRWCVERPVGGGGVDVDVRVRVVMEVGGGVEGRDGAD